MEPDQSKSQTNAFDVSKRLSLCAFFLKVYNHDKTKLHRKRQSIETILPHA